MAGTTVSIKDEASAKQWLELVREINTDYHNAMADASESLIDMKDFAEGTMIDDFVKYGTDLLNAAEVTFKAIDEIAETTIKVLDIAKNFLEGAVGGIAKLAMKVIN